METEITKRIRTSIENKLIELDAFVDDELPEYIMVMVANKKSKEQMDEDLSLFLGKNVGKFTSWLLGMLQVERGSNGKNQENSSKTTLDEDTTINHVPDDDDILALDAHELEADELEREFTGNLPLKKDSVVIKRDTVTENPNKAKCTDINDRVTAKQVFEKQSEGVTQTFTSCRPTKVLKGIVKSASAKLSDVDNMEDIEYDPQNPSLNVKSVANKVIVPERKSSIPLRHQANKLMLFKAIDEANKSVLSKHKLEEVYNPTPIKVLASSSNDKGQVTSKYKDYIPSPISKSRKNTESEEEYVPQPYVAWSTQDKSLILPVAVDEEMDFENYIPENTGRTVLFDPSAEELSLRISSESFNGESVTELETKPVSPHFVVTLDGFESGNRKRSWSNMSHGESSDKEDIENTDTDNMSPSNETETKKSKLVERCRYWPSCKNGDSCEFHHPTTPCKSFPNCKYGGKCFYVHPKCKFDSLCTRKDCPYTHTCKKEFPISKVPISAFPRSPYPVKFVPLKPSFSGNSTQCKFFPNCTAFKCPYFHPKPCRYGSGCQSSFCAYLHAPFPSPSKLKWKSESSY